MTSKMTKEDSKFISVFEPTVTLKDKVSVLKSLNKKDISGSSSTIQEFEDIISRQFDRKYALSVSNGSVALDLALNVFNFDKNDEIIVPKSDNSIEVTGSVQKATAMSYKKGLTTSAAINAAGGFGLDAKKSRVYVVYQNGIIQSTKTFLIFRKYPKLLPGSKVFVPKKAENNNKTSVGEIVGYTTSLVSIIALIKSL